ncbi:1591_t:CDS:2 [Paraglomus occultum]|uniref:1591_t:CDS:1 n=1 Tax=Paraglomus occultum TaxID=144539 RepID=A0A9N9DDL5_9GLOM|nr:1591_t:CDS:2 [Paraglomus occultum]
MPDLMHEPLEIEDPQALSRWKLEKREIEFQNHPQLISLDEATSALDTNTYRSHYDRYCNHIDNRSSLSTIVHADRVRLIKQGKAVEQGSHDELMQIENDVYFNLWNKHLKDRLKLAVQLACVVGRVFVVVMEQLLIQSPQE